MFGHHVTVLDQIEKDLYSNPVKDLEYIRIDGSHNTEAGKRTEACRKFQTSNKCRVALLSIMASGASFFPCPRVNVCLLPKARSILGHHAAADGKCFQGLDLHINSVTGCKARSLAFSQTANLRAEKLSRRI